MSEGPSGAWFCPFATGFAFTARLFVLYWLICKKKMHENIAVTLSHATTVAAVHVSEANAWV